MYILYSTADSSTKYNDAGLPGSGNNNGNNGLVIITYET